MSKKAFPEDWTKEVDTVEAVTVKSDIYKPKKESFLGDVLDGMAASPILYSAMAVSGFGLGYYLISTAPDLFILIVFGFLALHFLGIFWAKWKNMYIPEESSQDDEPYQWVDDDTLNPMSNHYPFRD